jgi:hypothetical protein
MFGVVRRFAGAREVLRHRGLAQFEQKGFVVAMRGAQGQGRFLNGHVGNVATRTFPARAVSKNGRELSRQQRFFTTRLCFRLSTSVIHATARSCGQAWVRLGSGAGRAALFQARPLFASRHMMRAGDGHGSRGRQREAAKAWWHVLCFCLIRVMLARACCASRERDAGTPENGAGLA